jgi:hypothetical protein
MPLNTSAGSFARRLGRTAAAGLTCLAALLLMACPKHQKAENYSDAESGLRLAININEVAYNSWNRLYEDMGKLHRTGRISEARWAAINAVDGVIVLSEADLIEGIERSKRLLAVWKQASVRVMTAESPTEVAGLRDRETEARRNFDNSIEFLNVRSLQLRDSYQEAVNLAGTVAREGFPVSSEAVAAIRNVIRLVDDEVRRARDNNGKLAKRAAQRIPAPDRLGQSLKPVLSQKSSTRARTVSTARN